MIVALMIVGAVMGQLLFTGFQYSKYLRYQAHKCENRHGEYTNRMCRGIKEVDHKVEAFVMSFFWPIMLPIKMGMLCDSATRQIAREEKRVQLEELRTERIALLRQNISSLEKATDMQ